MEIIYRQVLCLAIVIDPNVHLIYLFFDYFFFFYDCLMYYFLRNIREQSVLKQYYLTEFTTLLRGLLIGCLESNQL